MVMLDVASFIMQLGASESPNTKLPCANGTWVVFYVVWYV